jgi:hypothetical protein
LALLSTAALVAMAALLGACSATRSAGAPSSGAAPAPCDAAAVVAALQASYGPQVRIVYNGHLSCAGSLAEISVMVDNLESSAPGYTGPVGSPHGALMRYARGGWEPVDLSRPNRYCTADGRQTAAVPRALGTVCGIQ